MSTRPTHLVIYATRFESSGGIESHLLNMCSRFTDFKITVVLRTATDSDRLEALRRVARVVIVDRHSRWQLGVLLLGLLIRPPNALYTNGQGASVFAFRSLVPRGVWVHHHHMAATPVEIASWPRMYKRALAKADVLVACNRGDAGFLQGEVGREVQVIYAFSQDLSAELSWGSPAKDTTNLGYMGRLVVEKGLLRIIQLSRLDELAATEWHVWGHPTKQISEQDLEGHKRLNFHGPTVEGPQQALRSIDALVLLTTHPEGLPISVLEAVSFGCPILATDAPWLNDLNVPRDMRVEPQVLAEVSDLVARVQRFNGYLRTEVALKDSKQLAANYARALAPEVLERQWAEVFRLTS